MNAIFPAGPIYFFACDETPAADFAVFAKELEKSGIPVEVFAMEGAASKKFDERGVKINGRFSIGDLLEEEQKILVAEIANQFVKASVVVTGLGHFFDIKIQEALKKREIRSYAYYGDSCPGGYSEVAEWVMKIATKVLFANSNLANGSVGGHFGVGIGYYPVEEALKIASKKKSVGAAIRLEILKQEALKMDQKLMLYLGKNKESLLTFLDSLAELKKSFNMSYFVVLFQNQDKALLKEWSAEHGMDPKAPRFEISEWSEEDALAAADAVFYDETRLMPLFPLIPIPAVQVRQKAYRDILVKNGLAPSATNSEELRRAFEDLENRQKIEPNEKEVFALLGLKENWFDHLKEALIEL